MKKKILALLVLLVILFIPKSIAAEEAFTIEDYQIDITVTGDGRYIVDEVIDTNFTVRRHGIYRYIPEEYIMNFDGTPYVYNFGVKNIEVYDDDYETSTEDGFKIIRIGDADHYVFKDHRYHLRYTIQTYDLGLEDGRQLFYLNLIGNGWNTTIAHADITIHFYAPIENQNDLQVYSSKVSSYWQDKQTLKIETNEMLVPNEAVTAYLQYTDGYLVFPDYSFYTFGAIIVFTAILAFFVVLYYFYGKDKPLDPEAVYTPPKNLDPAAMGYIIDNNVSQKNVLSLFFYWGQQGYIQMEEDRYEDLSVVKLKDLDGDVPDYQLTFFNELFKTKKKVELSSISTDFIKAFNSCKTGIYNYFKGDKAIYTSLSKAAMGLSFAVGCFPFGVILGLAAYSRTYRTDVLILNIVIGSFLSFFVQLLITVLRQYWYNMKKQQQMVYSISIGVLAAIILFFFIGLEKEYVSMPYFVIAIVLTLGYMLITVPMTKRTEYGQKALSQCVGFRNFILNFTEEDYDRMEKDDPEYYYTILPYAYSLGLTDVWLGHFESADLSVPPCRYYYYRGRRADRFYMGTVSHSMNRVQHSIEQTMYSSSSGSGGGHSSGGFSGGGFGGGGGGSW